MGIYYFSPYSLSGDLGKAYNESVALVPNDDDWVCLMDMDTIVLSKAFGHQLNAIVTKHPNIGVFTCVTNRVGTHKQLVKGLWHETDIQKHRAKAIELQEENYDTIEVIRGNVSGLLLLFTKGTWKAVGGFKEGSMLGVDYDFVSKVRAQKKDIALMKGVYLTHYYRFSEGAHYTEHLNQPSKSKLRYTLSRYLRRLLP